MTTTMELKLKQMREELDENSGAKADEVTEVLKPDAGGEDTITANENAGSDTVESEAAGADDTETEVVAPKQNAAWAAARKRERELENKLREQAEKLAKLEGFMQGSGADKKEPEKPKTIDPVEKPQEYAEYLEGRVTERTKQLEDKLDRYEAEQRILQLEKIVEAEEKAYAEKMPDYLPSLEFLRKTEGEKIAEHFPDATKAEIDAEVKRIERDFKLTAKSRGMNPYLLLRMSAQEEGFEYKEQPKKQAETKPDLDKVRQNRERSASLAGAGGTAKGSGYTRSEVMKLPLGKKITVLEQLKSKGIKLSDIPE